VLVVLLDDDDNSSGDNRVGWIIISRTEIFFWNKARAGKFPLLNELGADFGEERACLLSKSERDCARSQS
jgi:hypothetical protein